CPSGHFKVGSGPGGCEPCPASSNTLVPGSAYCPCSPRYYRADADPAHAACTRPPSAPRSIVSQLNDTSVTLEWSEPLDRGGRSDLTYRLLCSVC
uniref:Fibronectin type-III domain-containing protein n=2 Tax=Tetraodon nigroviridis TaxID=99883 RepID=H3BYK9_TETNG